MRQEWKYDPADLSPYFWGALGCIVLGWWLNSPWSPSVAFGAGVLCGLLFIAIESERPEE